MSTQDQNVWHVMLMQENGRIQVQQKLMLAQPAQQEFQDGGDKTLVHMPKDTVLCSAIVSNDGCLPSGAKPVIEGAEDSPDRDVSFVWLSLGYLVPKSDLSQNRRINAKSGNKTSGFKRTSTKSTGQKSSETSVSNNNDKMTFKQRRFLFRLLAMRNIKGEEAEIYLKHELDVDELNDASKKETSALIDRLVTEGGDQS